MPLEKGGRADKIGNRYEIRCIIYEMLKILKEVNYSIVIEALGDDEMGTDILITDFEGKKEHQQCKVRNASKEYWTIADLKARNILNNWKKQLERGADRKVALVSTVGCTHIVDLHTRAINSTDNPAEFYEYQIKAGSKEFQTSYEEFCKGMGLESSETVDVVKSIDYLQRINFKQMSEYTLQESILQEIGYYFTTDKERVYSAFVSLVVDSDIFAKEITALELRNHFIKQGIRMRLLDGDKRIIPQVELINKEYRDSFKVHTAYCTKTCLNAFLEAVEKYVSPKSCEWYKWRMDNNKRKEYPHAYWSFWGDFQYHILKCIPYERLSSKYKELLNVLDRKFQGKADRYINREGHSGWVKSPVTGKKIGKKQWLQIITNWKISDRNHSQWKEVDGGFIESSLIMYAGDFQNAVENEPIGMIKMVIENKEDVVPAYIDAMYSGAEFSGAFEQIEQKLWEKMFGEFPCDMKSQRAQYFCGIIEKAKIYSWSDEVIEKLKEIAINYEEREEEKTKDNKELNCEELISKSLNCMKGHAIRAMGHLLWDNMGLFAEFKDVVDKLILDDNEAIRMACFDMLRPIYNIDREYGIYVIQ